MNLPSDTQRIFDHLRQGHFLSANSQQPHEQALYQAVQRHEAELRAYFAPLGLMLKSGNGYVYFAQVQTETRIREQVDRMGRWFEGYFFLKSWDPKLGPGTLLEVPQMVEEMSEQPALRKLLRELTLKGNPSSLEARLIAFFRTWERASLLQQTRETPLTYQVLNAFDFMDQLIRAIPSES